MLPIIARDSNKPTASTRDLTEPTKEPTASASTSTATDSLHHIRDQPLENSGRSSALSNTNYVASGSYQTPQVRCLNIETLTVTNKISPMFPQVCLRHGVSTDQG